MRGKRRAFRHEHEAGRNRKRSAFIADTFRRNFGRTPVEFAYDGGDVGGILRGHSVYVRHVAGARNRRAMYQVSILISVAIQRESRLVGTKQRNETMAASTNGNRIRSIRARESLAQRKRSVLLSDRSFSPKEIFSFS